MGKISAAAGQQHAAERALEASKAMYQDRVMEVKSDQAATLPARTSGHDSFRARIDGLESRETILEGPAARLSTVKN